uniref:Putative permease n=1 Tax=Desulfovibrio sp. U5L TaxID=596152 RepID=I2Q0H3_9BACT
MNWLTPLFFSPSTVQAVVVLGLTVTAGLAIGHIRICGIRLGVGGVLFSGLAAGHMGLAVERHVLDFAREFGLILFVYTIGMQVGPGFVDSLRRRGLRLNAVAALIVLFGAGLAAAFHLWGGLSLATAVGLLSGATTNTPSLAAASQAFMEAAPALGEATTAQAGLGYAVAYPFGIFGIILVMLVLRALFRIDPARELRQFEEQLTRNAPPLAAMTIEVAARDVFGLSIAQIAGIKNTDVVVSRVMAQGETRPATDDTVLVPGMLLHAVGRQDALDALCRQIGSKSATDLPSLPGPLEVRRLYVTRSGVIGKTVPELGLLQAHEVRVTRIRRSGTEFTPGPDIPLHFGDLLRCVGVPAQLAVVEKLVGNSARDLAHPHVLPLFLGIVLGAILGSLPVPVPGLPTGVKLGVAGGPLLVSIVLSRLHHFGGLVWYMPESANLILREVGICLFLACVGLAAGDRFLPAVLSGQGLYWLLAGAAITFLPLLAAGIFGRIVLGCNYASTCGLLAGSMTDPPALAFATQMLGSDAPASVYATVYPLTMILRIIAGQVLVLVLYPV